MRLAVLLIICSALIVRTCLGGIVIETSKLEQSGLVEAAVNVLKACYINQVGTVGLAGSLAGTISKTLWYQQSIPAILIDKTTTTLTHERIRIESRRRLKVFLVTAMTSITIGGTLKEIKNSIWWNHMASVLILDQSTIQGCYNAFDVLWAAWEVDLLASNFMCLHETRGWLIYTYNPYTNKAPEPWQLENTYIGKNNNVWTLFVRRYQENEKICDELNFDKTTDLGGHKIRASMANLTELILQVRPNEDGSKKLTGFNSKIIMTVLHKINATLTILDPQLFGETDANGISSGAVKEVTDGISDISLNFRFHMNLENYTTTYPFGYTGLSILSQYRGKVSQLSKIASLLDSPSRLGVCLVCLLNVLFFICCMRYDLSSAILNTLLLICNAGLSKIPKKLAPRFYLAAIFIFVVNIQGIYQGKLASLLTEQVDLQNVETLRDLHELGYTTYGPSLHLEEFRLLEPGIIYEWMYPLDCFNLVLEDPKVACNFQRDMMLIQAALHQLHISTKPVLTLRWVYMMRENWPIEKRLNIILSRLVEGDIIMYWYNRELLKIFNVLQATKDMKKDESFKVLTLPDLSFAFVILAVGLAFTTVCFIAEVGVATVRNSQLNCCNSHPIHLLCKAKQLNVAKARNTTRKRVKWQLNN